MDIVERLVFLPLVHSLPVGVADVTAEAATEIERLRRSVAALEHAISDALPGCQYMDPPDGGDVDLPEQLQRMSLDAARYRWLRDSASVVTPHVTTPDGWSHHGSAVDEVVDAAMKG